MPGKKGPKIGRKRAGHRAGPAVSRVKPSVTAQPPAPEPAPEPIAAAPVTPPIEESRPACGPDGRFLPGGNSHTGETFHRGRDKMPRGTVRLFYATILDDERETLYRQIVRGIRNSTKAAERFLERAGDRLEGKPTQRIEKVKARSTTFMLTHPDGTQEEVVGFATPKKPEPPAPPPPDEPPAERAVRV